MSSSVRCSSRSSRSFIGHKLILSGAKNKCAVVTASFWFVALFREHKTAAWRRKSKVLSLKSKVQNRGGLIFPASCVSGRITKAQKFPRTICCRLPHWAYLSAYGLATGCFIGDCRAGGNRFRLGEVSPAKVFDEERFGLWLRIGTFVRAATLDHVSRAQRPAPRGDFKNEITALQKVIH